MLRQYSHFKRNYWEIDWL